MLTTLVFRPGIYSDVTDYTAEGTWIDGSLIRWRDGLPENMRPWRKFSSTQLMGVPRSELSWSENDGTKVFAVGTAKRLYLYRSGQFYNITPIASSGTLAIDPFTTASGSSIVTVEHTANDRAIGDIVSFSGATTVNGVDVDGEYTVLTIVDGNNYTIETGTVATGDGAGGGAAVDFSYEISIGKDSAIFGRGYGAGLYGASTYGTARSSSTLKLDLRIWDLGNWGEDLLAMPVDQGKLYHWDATGGPDTRAQLVATAPIDNLGMIVSPEDRHVILLGAGGDPLAIEGCDQEDFTNWTVDPTTDVEIRRLLHGSSIITGQRSKDEILIWTNGQALYSFQYIGGAFVYNLRRVVDQISLMGKKAIVEYRGAVYWMGRGVFYRYDGQALPLPCSVLRTVFDDIDVVQGDKVCAGLNEQWSEIIWFYPTVSGGGENDRYVKLNTTTGEWDTGASGDLERTAWMDRNIYPFPMAASPDGYIYEHEIGDTDQQVTVTIKTRKYPAGDQTTKGPWTVVPTTKQIRRRARGREAAIRIEGTFTADDETKTWYIESGDQDIGDGDQVMLISRLIPDFKWGKAVRLGRIRADVQPDGGQ